MDYEQMVTMKKRATIIISGDVQDVGFRGTVMRLAQKAGLAGYVENLPDGTVRVVCEGEEITIKNFMRALNIRQGDVKVDNIHNQWSKVQGKFKYFQVKYSQIGAELFQGFATAGKKLETMDSKLDKINEATLRTHEHLGSIDNRLGDAIGRYDKIGKKMDNVETNLAELTKQITRLVDHVVEDKK